MRLEEPRRHRQVQTWRVFPRETLNLLVRILLYDSTRAECLPTEYLSDGQNDKIRRKEGKGDEGAHSKQCTNYQTPLTEFRDEVAIE